MSIQTVSLLDRGMVYALAHIRGGQELGRKWYDDGHMFKKVNSFTDFIDVTRWLTPDAPHRVGMSLGLNTAAPPAGGFAAQGQGPVSLDLGVRWRSRLEGGRHLDVSAWAQPPQRGPSPDAMGLIWQAQQPVYGTRVEVQWASSRTRGLVPEFGAIGVQLQGNSRLVLRARKGGPMLYYRAKF